jgi:hypothetical protein
MSPQKQAVQSQDSVFWANKERGDDVAVVAVHKSRANIAVVRRTATCSGMFLLCQGYYTRSPRQRVDLTVEKEKRNIDIRQKIFQRPLRAVNFLVLAFKYDFAFPP